MIKDFETFEGVGFGNGRYYLLNYKNCILEVKHDTNPENPLIEGYCPGDYGYGRDLEEAYANAWENMGSDTTDIIEERIDKFLDTTEVEVKAELSPKAMFDFCKGNDIDLSDIVLVKEVNIDPCNVTVIFIEAYDFLDFADIEMKDADIELKNEMLKSAQEYLERYRDGEVYEMSLYSKRGDFISNSKGLYGENAVKQALHEEDLMEEFDLPFASINKDLGEHKDIANCLYDVRDEIVQYILI